MWNHPNRANMLKLGGHVESYDMKKAAAESWGIARTLMNVAEQ